MVGRRQLLRPLAAGAALALVLLGAGPATGASKVAFTITADQVTESSGLTSDAQRKLYWTVNDSGDTGAAYALQPDGALAGILRFRAQPIDVEAVAVAGNRLYVADIGDNRRSREFVTVYFFDNPRPGATVTYRAYDFAYPDGPHDAETLLVDPTGRLYLVTKEARGGIYAAPGQPFRRGVNRLIAVGKAPPYVTDGVFLPGGDRIALRGYLSVSVLDAGSYYTVARAVAPVQPQGESLAVSLSGKALLLGSEGRDSRVYRIPVPRDLAKVPAAQPSPPGTPSASASPSPTPSAAAEEPEEEGVQAAGRSRQGTLLALTLAAFTALVAGVVVAAVRK